MKTKRCVKIPETLLNEIKEYASSFPCDTELYNRAIRLFFHYYDGMQIEIIKEAYKDVKRVCINPYMTDEEVERVTNIGDNFNDGFCRLMGWCLNDMKKKSRGKPIPLKIKKKDKKAYIVVVPEEDEYF